MRIDSHYRRGLVAAVVLAAFCLHVLVPEGFMPGAERLSMQLPGPGERGPRAAARAVPP